MREGWSVLLHVDAVVWDRPRDRDGMRALNAVLEQGCPFAAVATSVVVDQIELRGRDADGVLVQVWGRAARRDPR